MAYKQRQDGSFRMRASFPISPELVERANLVCGLEGLSMYQLCRKAVEHYVEESLGVHRAGGAQRRNTVEAVQA